MNGSLGLNFGIILPSTDLPRLLLSASSMGEPPPLVAYGEQRTSNDALDRQLLERDRVLAALKEQLEKAQARMTHYADMKRREVQFEEGEKVLLKLRPYRQRSLAQ